MPAATSQERSEPAYTRVGALRPGGDDRRRSPAGALGLLRSPSGAFCEGNAETARNTLSGVDQSADDKNDASDWRTSHLRGRGRPAGTPHLQHLRGTRRLRLGSLSDPHAAERRADSGKPGVTVRPPSAAQTSFHGRRHINGCSLNTRSRCLKVIDMFRAGRRSGARSSR